MRRRATLGAVLQVQADLHAEGICAQYGIVVCMGIYWMPGSLDALQGKWPGCSRVSAAIGPVFGRKWWEFGQDFSFKLGVTHVGKWREACTMLG